MHRASVPGEQSITTDLPVFAGFGRHEFSPTKTTTTTAIRTCYFLLIERRRRKKRQQDSLNWPTVDGGAAFIRRVSPSSSWLLRCVSFFPPPKKIDSGGLESVHVWPGLHFTVVKRKFGWLCTSPPVDGSARTRRAKVTRCSSHPGTGGALLLRLYSSSSPPSSMPIKVQPELFLFSLLSLPICGEVIK